MTCWVVQTLGRTSIALKPDVLSARTTQRSSCKSRLEVRTSRPQHSTGVVSAVNNGMTNSLSVMVGTVLGTVLGTTVGTMVG